MKQLVCPFWKSKKSWPELGQRPNPTIRQKFLLSRFPSTHLLALQIWPLFKLLNPDYFISDIGRTSFRKLTPIELQIKCELNLCFNCDEKYHKGYKCSSIPQLLLLIADDDATEDFPSDFSPPPSNSPPPYTTTENPSLLSISWHTLFGGPHPTTIRVATYIKGLSVQILLDEGSTHNFIQPHAAKALKLLIELSSGFSVMVENGKERWCLVVVLGVALTIMGFSFATDFFIIDMHGSDLVLRVAWLATLLPCLTDYVNRNFEFK